MEVSARTRNRYRIGIDARFFRRETGGIGRYTRELLAHLFSLDTVTEYYIFLTEKDLAEWEFNQENVHPVVVPIAHYSVAEQTKFLRTLYQYNLDLVHFLNFNHPLLYRRPFVTTLHDLTILHFPTTDGSHAFVREKAFRLVLSHAVKAAKKVIAISEYTAQDAEKNLGLSHAKMAVIYEGGPVSYQLLAGAKDSIRKYLGTTEPYFLFVSQWRTHKGILTQIEAFNRFKEKTGLPHKLVLVGKKNRLEKEVQEQLVNSPFAQDILTPGFAPDELLPALYYYSVCHVVPSEYEGFGLTVLEAYANGAPAIVANNSSLPEVAGEGALYFPTGDVNALTDAMIRFTVEPELRANLLAKGVQQLKKFSWNLAAEETVRLYYAVLEKKR